MTSFYYSTFARVCLLPYIGGTIFHILRLIYKIPIEAIPCEMDWFIVVVGGYGGLGLLIFINRINFKNTWDKIVYGLLIFHLDGSVIAHAYMLFEGNHNLLSIFPLWYSLIAIGYFLTLGLYVYSLNKRFAKWPIH